MNQLNHQNFAAQVVGNRSGDAPSLQCMLEVSSALLAQAEALMSACRAMVENGQQTPSGDPEPASRTGSGLLSRARPQQLCLDLFEIFRRHFPDLQRSGVTVLVTLLSNTGRLVEHFEMRAAIDTASDASVKVHICRLRSALKRKGISARVSTVRGGGYGLTRDAAESLLSSIEFDAGEIKRLQQMVPDLFLRDTH